MTVKNRFLVFIFLSLFSFSCGNVVRTLFGTETPHEAYAEKLDGRGLDKTPEGRAWLAASKAALKTPVPIGLPYHQQGYFHVDKPRALGLQFTAKRGQRLTVTLTGKGTTLPLYADLFRAGENGNPLLSADTSTSSFQFDADEGGDYVLRLQPELFQSGAYTLSVSAGPSLDFPVSGKKASVGSIWGDARDRGKRSHEGIDIFAPKLTPALAAADGYITGVREGGIGGKVVWLRPNGKAYTLYYAHLDRQLVQEGQQVKKGDVVGLVGNTGNARTTPSHLHFGVYSDRGPMDPLPFVNREVKTAPLVADKKLTTKLALKKAYPLANGSTVQANTFLVPLGANASGYLAEAPDGSLLQLLYKDVEVTKEVIRKTPHATVATAPPPAKKS